MMMTSSSFTTGWNEPLPDDVARAIGTCVAAMSQLTNFEVRDLPLPLLKALAERTEPLEDLAVVSPPGVNWVSVNVFCQCAHKTVLLVADVRVLLSYIKALWLAMPFIWNAMLKIPAMPLTESTNPSFSRKHTIVPQCTAATGSGKRTVDVSHIFNVMRTVSSN